MEHQKLTLSDRVLAYRQDGQHGGSKPGLIFLPGYHSDMTGSKACFLAERCEAEGRSLLRFDYRGHGFSSDTFENGCIGDWLDDSIKICDALTKGPQIIIGSSMGGWLMLLLALARPARIAGLVGIAAAPDFTEDLVWGQMNAAQRREMQEKGVIFEHSEYGPPLAYTLKLVEEGRKHLLLRDETIKLNCPVRLIQGMEDKDVPWQTATRISDKLQGKDVRLTLIKDGEHRLSRESDLHLLWQEINSLS